MYSVAVLYFLNILNHEPRNRMLSISLRAKTNKIYTPLTVNDINKSRNRQRTALSQPEKPNISLFAVFSVCCAICVGISNISEIAIFNAVSYRWICICTFP